MRAGALDQRVNVHRPTSALDSRGQANNDTVYWRDVPCSIETLSGQEQIVARQLLATATYKIAMYGNPEKRLETTDRLEWGMKDGKPRLLEIGQIRDLNQNGVQLELICGEVL